MRGVERITKAFLDSRYCLPDGSIEIPGGGLLLDPSDRCWLAEFSTVASWDTIDGTNSILYVVVAGNVLRSIPLTLGTNVLFSFPTGNTLASEHRSGFVDLRRAHNIFVHAPGFGNNNTLGVTGARDILAKVGVDVGYGGTVTWHMSGSEHDCVEVGTHSLTVLNIELRDVAGNIIDGKGNHWSATLVFSK